MALEEAAIMARTKEARERADLTQQQVADALEVHQNTVANWERQYVAPLKDLARFAAITHTTVEWILHGDDAPVEGLAERLDRMERMLAEVLVRLPPAAASR